MIEILNLCKKWSDRTHASRKNLQKLVGKLLYLHRCIPTTRLFVNRILWVLRQTPPQGVKKLPSMFYKDLAWFLQFLEVFNGSVQIFKNVKPAMEVHVDSSLTDVGGIFQDKVYTCPIPKRLLNVASIVHLEAANIIMATRIWFKNWSDCIVQVYCDNNAVVESFNSDKMKDVWLMACKRTLWLYAAMYNIEFQFFHIAGICNTKADILSRWSTYRHLNTCEVRQLKACYWEPVCGDMLIPDFNI